MWNGLVWESCTSKSIRIVIWCHLGSTPMFRQVQMSKASAISRLSATWIEMAPAAHLLAPRHDRRLDRLELSLPGARWGTGEVLIHGTLRCHQTGHTWPWKIQENPPINGGFNNRHGRRGISNSAGDAKLDDPLGTIPTDTLGGGKWPEEQCAVGAELVCPPSAPTLSGHKCIDFYLSVSRRDICRVLPAKQRWTQNQIIWVKQCHKPSPSHHHVYRWYKHV